MNLHNRRPKLRVGQQLNKLRPLRQLRLRKNHRLRKRPLLLSWKIFLKSWKLMNQRKKLLTLQKKKLRKQRLQRKRRPKRNVLLLLKLSMVKVWIFQHL